MLDGVDVNDQQNGFAFTSVLRVTLDSVQEFRITTTNANADQGRSSGAQVSLITKSGSNKWRGSLYEFHRNTITSANDFFNSLMIRICESSLPRRIRYAELREIPSEGIDLPQVIEEYERSLINQALRQTGGRQNVARNCWDCVRRR